MILAISRSAGGKHLSEMFFSEKKEAANHLLWGMMPISRDMMINMMGDNIQAFVCFGWASPAATGTKFSLRQQPHIWQQLWKDCCFFFFQVISHDGNWDQA